MVKFIFDKPQKPPKFIFPLNEDGSWRWIPRSEWGARDPVKDHRLKPLVKPCTHTHFTFTSTDKCLTRKACLEIVAAVQKRDMEKYQRPDIIYNFLIGGNGHVYEGRGLDYQPDRFNDTFGMPSQRCVDIAYIGEFCPRNPPKALMLATAKGFLKSLIDTNIVRPKCRVFNFIKMKMR